MCGQCWTGESLLMTTMVFLAFVLSSCAGPALSLKIRSRRIQLSSLTLPETTQMRIVTPKFPFISLLLGIWLFAVLSPTAKSQTPQDFLDSLVDQRLILRHFGDVKEAKLKKDKLADTKGTCDVAVQVKTASWDRGRARLQWEQIGLPYVPGKPRGVCRKTVVFSDGSIEISAFAFDEPVSSLAASMSLILQTPEQYLAAEGIAFNLPPEPDIEKLEPPPSQPFTRPKVLLTVDPAFSEDARRAKYKGSLTISLYVGTDGRVHRPTVVRKLGLGLDEMALNVLPMWRFEPARKLDKPVAVQQSMEIDFHLY
jgi:hypothetical protein